MEITLSASDGQPIGATVYGDGQRALLVMPATGVPRELGVKSIGHFGFFRERFRDSLWREAADWLETVCES